ncbi:hypothetical protein [Halanaerobium sp.]|jgi:type II secretory pathway component PulC|uniref:hypothetical protein n=1 Tax=Halanaerobium sp. TaxID=1895664 RepID=UPI000DE76E37|nr:hypothetical protein [Halanaerobium sp.]PUU87466.1 MAG: hypothetical protein CI949_3542 [Halanaerobium sp.]
MNKKFIFLLVLLISSITILSFTVSAEDKNEKLYSEKEFRNPFVEYVEPVPEPPAEDNDEQAEQQTGNQAQNNVQRVNSRPAPPKITVEDVKNGLPFSLNGIISSNRERVALLNTGVNVELIRGNYQKDGYKIIAIKKDSVIVENRGFKLRLKIGGEIDEI